jgi:hypothetical protein
MRSVFTGMAHGRHYQKVGTGRGALDISRVIATPDNRWRGRVEAKRFSRRRTWRAADWSASESARLGGCLGRYLPQSVIKPKIP